jgi:two-component system, chemotaxis family, chemotaxis protein CheY
MSKGSTVLVADDELHIRVMLSTLLQRMGVEVVGEAVNGEDAIRRYRETQPDLLLMDINMPVKTGEEALSEIMAEFPQARVILLTSMADLKTVESCLEAGAFNYMRKDSPLEEIQDAIREALV